MRLCGVVFDVDDVWLNMGECEAAGQRAMGAALETSGLSSAPRAVAGFAQAMATLRADLQSDAPRSAATEEWLRDIRAYQQDVERQGYELKRFSRETMLAAALRREGAPVSGPAIVAAVTAYWAAVRAATGLYPAAAEWWPALRTAGISVHLATNSDGYMDWRAGAFVYDPERARARKRARLDALWQLGIAPEQVSIGDPFGKPDPRFYEGVRGAAGVGAPEHWVAVGDSLRDDVAPFLEDGFGAGLWLVPDHGGPPERYGPKLWRVGRGQVLPMLVGLARGATAEATAAGLG